MARLSKKDQLEQEVDDISVEEQQETVKEDVIESHSGNYCRKELPDGTIIETF